MKYEFIFDNRIEIDTPVIHVPMEQWDLDDLNRFFEESQKITSKIPAKILEIDKKYMDKYDELQRSPDSFFEIMEELNEMSGKISELNVLYLRLEGKFLYAGGGHF